MYEESQVVIKISIMQKPPRFGEKISFFDEKRESESFELYKEFISRKYYKSSASVCEDLANFSVFNVVKDSQGLHGKFGLKTSTFHYLSVEETYFLATRKIIGMNPAEILKNTHVFLQKILLYSFFKRKGAHIKTKDTSLLQAMEIHLELSPKKLQDSNPLTIRFPDDKVDQVPGDYYIDCESSFEKTRIQSWNLT